MIVTADVLYRIPLDGRKGKFLNLYEFKVLIHISRVIHRNAGPTAICSDCLTRVISKEVYASLKTYNTHLYTLRLICARHKFYGLFVETPFK